ncbi:MAG: hypothetical protein EBS84_21750 [Proteobacteria bacterium]|nr:hypothetical protein [Pseudomonadota bacterium]
MNDAEKSKLEQELKEAAPLINRLSDGPSVLPDHIKARLNAALDKKFPLAAQQAAEEPAPARNKAVEQEKPEPSWLEVWRWWIGLATATAAVALIVVLNRPGPNLPPVIQVAMLDSIGATRGTNASPLTVIQQQWKDVKPVEFSDNEQLKQWQKDWEAGSNRTVAKIVYDRDAGVIRVTVRSAGRLLVERSFEVKAEQDLPSVLESVKSLIKEQAR